MNDNITVKTTTGMTTIARENIAAFTIVGPTTMEIHLKSGTIFTTRDMVVEPLAKLILVEDKMSKEIERLGKLLADADLCNICGLDYAGYADYDEACKCDEE